MMNELIRMEERIRRPIPQEPLRRQGGDDGPRQPEIRRPDTRELLRRMRRVDPQQARKYRQRSGE